MLILSSHNSRMGFLRTFDKAASREADGSIADMVDQGFLSQKHASILREANSDDPNLARWFIATIHHHTVHGGTLSDKGFADLCLMGLHRYNAQQGVIKNAVEHPEIKRLLNDFNKAIMARDADDIGLKVAIGNYLTRTPQDVGLAFAQRLQDGLSAAGKTLADLKGDATDYFRLRATTEKEYITRPDQNAERAMIEAAIASLPDGRTLNDLLRKGLEMSHATEGPSQQPAL
jgi:hypothetical protein